MDLVSMCVLVWTRVSQESWHESSRNGFRLRHNIAPTPFNQIKQNILIPVNRKIKLHLWALFPFPPTSHDLQYISVTSGFTRLSMNTTTVCRGIISLYVRFHSNRTM